MRPRRRGTDSGVYERRHPGRHQGRRRCLRFAGPGLSDRAVQHLSSAPASRRRCGASDGRPAPVHALGRPYSHRFRRIPGVFPGQPAEDHGGGRHLRQSPGRSPDLHGPGGEYAHPVQPGLGYRYGLRRVRGEPGRVRLCQGQLPAHAPVAGAVQGGARPAQCFARYREPPADAVRHQPGSDL